MKLWLCTIFTMLMLAALPGMAQTVWFDRSQTIPDIINLPEPMMELRVYDFTPLVMLQGRIDASSAILTPMSTQDNRPKGDIKVVAITDNITSQFTPISMDSITQFTHLTFTPLN